ncbi:hypothetical protein E4K10_26020 [Streptomyces sp. T1317-0309]|nr:hypothetical protein E4K10_26020 [Streptomyces sp. T1317-0309]
MNHLRARPLLVVLATATALAAAPAVAYADGGRPAPVTGGIPLVNTDEKIGPGIDLQHVKALDQKGWYDAQYLTVDLSDRAVGTDLLTSGPVSSGGPLSEAADKAGAVAGVNGEFFDIGNSNAALGGEVQDGKLVKSADIAAVSTSASARTASPSSWTSRSTRPPTSRARTTRCCPSTPRTAAGCPRTA